MSSTPLDKALAQLTNFGNAEYQRGYRDGLKIAEQIAAWLYAVNPGSDATIEDVKMWNENLLKKAKEKEQCE